MKTTKRLVAAAVLAGTAVMSAPAIATAADSVPPAGLPLLGYPGSGYLGYPLAGPLPAGPPVVPGSTQALYNNNAVASGTQGLLNKIAFGVL
ncbi:hypothetical protein ACPYPE_23960 [Streptomyces griseus]|uniref:hypothetical protein n=1 Tax=Streptomyces griseus TaxID=1911 RepID=UPI003CF282DB